jgi:hypothetical protein
MTFFIAANVMSYHRTEMPSEKVIYKWTRHYFDGIGETNLVLQPPSATQGDKLEWRF